MNNKTQNISGNSTTTTIDWNFLDVNAQLDLPNNNDVDTLLSFFGSSITTLQTEMDAVEGKTAGLIANGSNTESTDDRSWPVLNTLKEAQPHRYADGIGSPI